VRLLRLLRNFFHTPSSIYEEAKHDPAQSLLASMPAKYRICDACFANLQNIIRSGTFRSNDMPLSTALKGKSHEHSS
jgi:hypothetical protein